MKIKSLKLTFVIVLFFGVMSLTSFKINSIAAAGVYGVCDCGEDNSNELQLTLNADHSFQYINKTHSSGTINISGSWEQDGNKVLLKNFDNKSVLKDKWVLVASEKCIKSRKGLEWTRLCLIKPCR